VRIDFDSLNRPRAQVMNELRQRGIGTQVHYLPVPYHPFYGAAKFETYPGAHAYYNRCLSLPLFPAMDVADVKRVVTTLQEVLDI